MYSMDVELEESRDRIRKLDSDYAILSRAYKARDKDMLIITRELAKPRGNTYMVILNDKVIDYFTYNREVMVNQFGMAIAKAMRDNYVLGFRIDKSCNFSMNNMYGSLKNHI